MHQCHAFPFDFLSNDAQEVFLFLWLLGQKHHSGAVFSLFGYRDALQQDKFVRYLNHDAGSVAGLAVGAFGSPVLHVFQHLQGIVYQSVCFCTVQVDYHADTAGVMFVGRIVQPLSRVVLTDFSVWQKGSYFIHLLSI